MIDQRERRLLLIAVAFLLIYSLILTLSPAVRQRSWAVSFRLSHWIGFVLWAAAVYFAHRTSSHRLPYRDPYLLPLASLLSGWGLLTIWRLDTSFAVRQIVWLGVSVAAFIAILLAPMDLNFLRRHKYVLLTSGLALTALTLLLGTNPAGFGPRLWLGCCGFYLQPSEPLKLLLVVYLTAYLADRLPVPLRAFPLLVPTILVTGLALLILIVQRDLGTASIFILLYTSILYLATDKRRVLVATAIGLLLAGLTGFFFVEIIHVRLESWLNPWNDPSGHSYQIIQSLLAVANGGIFGRGPGLGSPGLVPVAHSDFIFSAIAEETGLTGTIGMVVIFAMMLARGLIASLRARISFHRLLAAGLTAYLGIQTLLIIGGNLRLLPLTGVTLPFVSYGGSSLLTSFVALALLLDISNQPSREPVAHVSSRPYFVLAGLLALGLLAASVADGWWAVIRGPDLLTRTDNPRRAIADRYVRRGALLDRNSEQIDATRGRSGFYYRVYLFTGFSSVIGYTHSTYGQAGLEASLDDYLRGLQANPSSLILWDELLYGMPPPGLDVRLTIDLSIQRHTDSLLGTNKGAIVLLNAQTGEILAMTSHPTYDPNKLDELGSALVQDKNAPLLNRAAQGIYPVGTASEPFLMAISNTDVLTEDEVKSIYQQLGFYSKPQIRMPVATNIQSNDLQSMRVSPLQMAIAAATLSNAGTRPPPRIALAVNTPQEGWVVLPALSEASHALSPESANDTAFKLAVQNGTYWEWTGLAQSEQQFVTWYLAGTLPNWKGTPLALVVLLEESSPLAAQRIGQQLMQTAITP